MTILQADDIVDLVKMTLRELGRMKWTEIATDLQEYVALPQLLQKERVGFQSGYGIQWNVMTTHSGAAKDTGLYATDVVNVGDVMQTANIPWRHITTNWAIERREIAMNRTPARIVEMIQIRRADSQISLAVHIETRFWSRPTSSTVGDGIYGVPYWIVYNATEGFNGGDLASFAAGPGNLSSATHARWKNYTAKYVTVSKSDLVTKWRKAATFTNFMSPVPVPSYNTGNRYGYYTNYDVIGPLESALEAQNDNLGNDIASKDGKLLFRQNPVVWVPHLENRTGDPVYGINWGVFKPTFLTGEYMREEGPVKATGQNSVMQVHVDTTMNVRCTDRRRLFLLATADPDTTS